MACLPASSTTSFSPLPSTVSCVDADPCTIAEHCDGAGACTGTVYKDTDGDGFIDAACPNGTDCDDGDAAIKPGIVDPFEGIAPVTVRADRGGPYGDDLSIAMDSTGVVHAAWYNNIALDLEYATNKQGFWSVATIESAGDVGSHAAIAVDSLDIPHIVYHDAAAKDLHHATLVAGAWAIENVTSDTTATVGLYAAIAAGADGVIHVAYYDSTNSALVYRTRTTAGWQPERVVESAEVVGQRPSLALDSQGNVHLSYFQVTRAELHYATNASGVFVPETVDTAGGAGRYSALAIDAGGRPNVLYLDDGPTLKHAVKPADVWLRTTQAASSLSPSALRMSLAATEDGGLLGCVMGGDTFGTSYFVTALETSVTNPAAEDWTVRIVSGALSETTYCGVAATRGRELWWTEKPAGRVMRAATSVGPGAIIVDGYSTRGGYASLAQDDQGGLHVAYHDGTVTSLRYAYKAPQKPWARRLVDNSASVGLWTSIAVDSAGAAHIAYRNDTARSVLYVKGDIDGFGAPEIVDNSGNVGEPISLALDEQGAPSIAYRDVANSDLKFAARKGVWVPEVVDAVGNVGEFAAMAAGPNATFHIAYRQAASDDLMYVTGQSGAWSAPVAAQTDGDCGRQIGITVDGAGGVHISHLNVTGADAVTYTRKPAGGAFTSQIVATGVANERTDVGLDAWGNPYVSYWKSGLVVASRIGALWRPQQVTTSGGTSAALVVGDAGDWHIAFRDAGRNDLMYASSDAPVWPVAGSLVALPGSVGEYTSLVVDAADDPHVVYFDATNTALKYTRYLEGRFFSTTLEDVNDVGRFASAGIDAAGRVHVAYRDQTAGALRYGLLDSGIWNSEIVETGNMGNYASLALGSDATVHIAYRDDGANDLRYARGAAGFFLSVLLDGSGDTGRFATIALDGNDRPHIAYQYVSSSDLRYVAEGPTGWQAPVTVESANSVGHYASIAIEAAGAVHVVHKDATSNDLRHATNRTGAWTSEAVDTFGNIGDDARLVLDAADNLYVLYRDAAANDVKLATNLSGAWQTFVVDAQDNVGIDISAQLASDGAILVSYQDSTAKELRVTRVTIDNAVDQDCDGY